jgi:hypothetical protein
MAGEAIYRSVGVKGVMPALPVHWIDHYLVTVVAFAYAEGIPLPFVVGTLETLADKLIYEGTRFRSVAFDRPIRRRFPLGGNDRFAVGGEVFASTLIT